MHEVGSSSALELNCANLLGAETVDAMRRADRYLQEQDTVALLQQVGTVIPELALSSPTVDKRHFPASYGGGKPCGNDLLSACGCFYVTLDGKIMLDCTSGHYQMTWGYNQPELMAVAKEGLDIGVVWDNHANNPGIPVKVLTEKLGEIIESMGMDRAMFGVCTGSVACTTAMKVMLIRYERDEERKKLGKPVMVVLAGNYHGTDIAAQAMRGMWPGFVTGMEVVEVEPNVPDELTAAFEKYGRRIAGLWVEPVMMNREAILVETEYLRLARELCTKYDTLLTFDEIQTGFWYPEIFIALRIGVSPDLIVVGKGMTAGFHPLAGILYRKDLDILEQYDSISTNGNASLASLIALANLELIAEESTRIEALGDQLINGFRCLAKDFPEIIEAINGEGLLAGIKLRTSEDAIGFQRVVLDRGLWVRVHAYHPGHRTVLCKLALSADENIVDFIISSMRSILETTAWR